jgi:hypothetical protein
MFCDGRRSIADKAIARGGGVLLANILTGGSRVAAAVSHDDLVQGIWGSPHEKYQPHEPQLPPGLWVY